MRNEWNLAMGVLAQMTPDALETLASVAARFGQRSYGVYWDRRDAARRGQLEDRPPCGHPVEHMWLTRHRVKCACRMTWPRGVYPKTEAHVAALNPKVHCNGWAPGDPVDRFHGRECGHLSGRRAASAGPARTNTAADHAERLELLLRGELTDATGLDMPWDPGRGTGSRGRAITRRAIGSPGFQVKMPGIDDPGTTS
jgi:hypothetical protein